MERLIQLVASLPCPSPLQTSMTNSFIGTLWNVLRHPPLSYVGNEFTYRAADGSNNVQLPGLRLIVEYIVSSYWKSRDCIRKECCTASSQAGSTAGSGSPV